MKTLQAIKPYTAIVQEMNSIDRRPWNMIFLNYIGVIG